ncbi:MULTISPECIES: AfsR/SARP family transcriptional regulator [Streptomyces]|uniref:BTAD domain-containing putative transcriptional regulator n=1 Tax=Streptomyces edwardsiae TaxID=3075527 RepID=A0ABU2PXN3_9ACTN|nr:BTAD domain-containing putative transcriptional regulator [Streptomyces sp. DSM 41636]MDT0396483.1 BTAD domain-containing putative transcriptional regulator [Streptomyces sp. DSM 41636]
MSVHFGVLGVVEVRRVGEPVEVGHARQRQVLAALVMDAGRVVPADVLVDRVWGEREPRRGREALYGYVSRLRGALSSSGADIVREQGGYRLMVGAGAVDVHRFRELSARAQTAPASYGDERRAALWEEALGLWRGEAFTGADTPWFNAQRSLLDQERLAAQSELVEARLRLGQHAAVLARLSAWAEQDPLDERVCGQLMLALYRSGRQAEALEWYEQVRRRLSEEMGLDPGARLRRLHQRVLVADPSLEPAGTASGATGERSAPEPVTRRRTPSTAGVPADEDAPAGAPPVRGAVPGSGGRASGARRRGSNYLPRDLPDFIGREDELARLTAAAAEGGVVCTVDGMAGVGKTAFAVHAGHVLAERFPDGVLFVDLQGHSPGKTPLTANEALEVLLGQLEIEAPGDAQAHWRARTAGLRLLLVLDNAVDETQVIPLLPAGASLVIVTSRARLSALAGARPMSLTVLPENRATEFFARLVGYDRAVAEPDAVAHVVRLCAGLPLALRLSGAQLAHRTAWPIAHLSGQLSRERERLPKLFADREVALAFRMSHEQLAPADRTVFYALGRHPGVDADAEVIAAMADMPTARADDCLQRLVDAHLAEEAVVGRYRQHDLLRQYARGLSEDPRMIERMLDHYLAAVAAATARLDDGSADAGAAHAWLTAEKGNLLAATRCAAAEGHSDYAWRLAISFWRFLGRDLAGDPIELLEQGVSAAREAADGGEAMLNTLLALAHWSAGRVSLAHDLLMASARMEGNTEFHAHSLALLGLMRLRGGDHAGAEEYAERASAELEKFPGLSPLGLDAKIITFWTRGVNRVLRAENDAALPYLRAAHAGCEELGQASPNDHVVTALARCLIALGDHEEALGHLRQVRELRQRIHDKEGEAEALTLMGTALRASGHAGDALELQSVAAALLDDDTRLQAYARVELGRTLIALGRTAEAIGQYEFALTVADKGHHLHEQAQAHGELAQALAPTEPRAARQHERMAADICVRLALHRPMSLPHLRPAGW